MRETLKRCSPSTYYAACKFRQAGGTDNLRLIVLGVMERFVDRELRSKVNDASDELRLREDLALDSLTMMEIVMLAEEVLSISVANEELTHLRTVGDVHRFMGSKLGIAPGGSARGAAAEWTLAAVGAEVHRIESAAATGQLRQKSPA